MNEIITENVQEYLQNSTSTLFKIIFKGPGLFVLMYDSSEFAESDSFFYKDGIFNRDQIIDLYPKAKSFVEENLIFIKGGELKIVGFN